jgi:hypothetical protein
MYISNHDDAKVWTEIQLNVGSTYHNEIVQQYMKNIQSFYKILSCHDHNI